MIFLGGINGVDKNTLLKQIKNKININYYKGGDLIPHIISKVVNPYTKSFYDDQLLLVAAIKDIKDKDFIFSGHFCLLNETGDIVKLPITTFEQMPIEQIFVLTEDPMQIINRVQKIGKRKYTERFVKEFQDAEVLYAKQIAKLKNVKLQLITNIKPIIDYYASKK